MTAGELAFLYPGQGSQEPGMLHRLPNTSAVRHTIEEATAAVGDIEALDTAAALRGTTNSQLALLICGVAAARAFADSYYLSPTFVAGHSVGTFAAAVTAGVLTFPEALTAVRLRGELMTQACASGRWGMAAVIGLRLPGVRDLLGAVDVDGDHLWIANHNYEDQVVLAGTTAALDTARQIAQRAAVRDFRIIDVNVASHGPVQSGTARALAAHFAGVPARTQTAAYFSNTNARRIRNNARAVLDDLAESVAHPVRWYDIARVLPEYGVAAAVQMPPGHVLTHLMRHAAPGIRSFSAAEDGFGTITARLGCR
jgi:malonate decarboxylase epsilon subunit